MSLVKSIGLDLASIDRVQRSLERYGDRFVRKILGSRELAVYMRRRDKAAFVAGRFAAKEAIIKGLGSYLEERPAFSSLEILPGPSGQPELVLPEHLKKQLVGVRCLISITHERDYAAAVAVFEEVG